MNALRIHVERAVKPLRASKLRKLRLQEEMLGHLKGIYEEEMERLGDHDAAVRGAIKKFGSAEELSQKLQTSVPWHDSMMHLLAPFLPNQGWRASVLSLTFWSWLVSLVLNAFGLCLVAVLRDRPRIGLEMFEMWLGLAILFPVLFGAIFVMAGAFHGVLLHPKSLRWAIIYGAGLLSFILIEGVLLYQGEEGRSQESSALDGKGQASRRGGSGAMSTGEPVRLRANGLKLGMPLPDVDVFDEAGDAFRFASLQGQYTVVVFGCLT